MKPVFRFKQFSISDSNCAMKLSSDAVLLGATAEPGQSKRILDIGSGCGILALMMAQKSKALVDAIEIDKPAAHQAAENFSRSKWAERLNIHHTSIQHYTESCRLKYDCIICNPPYFQGQLTGPDDRKNQAKHDTGLNVEELGICVKKLLSESGTFWVIIPASEKNNIQKSFLNAGLYGKKLIYIADRPGLHANRIICCFSSEFAIEAVIAEIFLKNHDGTLSEAYKELTGDFYLHL